MKRVMVAMSGGVDSSVAALLLKEQGYEVIGVTMCLGIKSPNGEDAKCCGAEAINDAKKVCQKLGVAHYVLDFSNEMNNLVIADFIAEYKRGRTPNPCARCNEHLKFAKLYDYARSMGCEYLATGHYVKVAKGEDGQSYIYRAEDKNKDQTYFLYGIPKEILPHLLFPIEGMEKPKVRELAAQADLPVANKAESQDICFVTGRSYREFLLEQGLAEEEGDIVDTEGKVLGRHKGVINYTIGQRGGLGIALGHPAYVVSLDAGKNQVVVGLNDDLMADTIETEKLNLLVDKLPEKMTAKIRFRSSDSPCRIEHMNDGNLRVIFEDKLRAITPGQSVVFYNNDIMLGGAIIKKVIT